MASPMHIKILSLKSFGIAFVLTLAFISFARAQQPALDGKTAEQVFKNIQVMQGTPASELNASMHLIRAALGVECEYCHVEGARDKDDKEPKQTARKMITMMMEINKTSF